MSARVAARVERPARTRLRCSPRTQRRYAKREGHGVPSRMAWQGQIEHPTASTRSPIGVAGQASAASRTPSPSASPAGGAVLELVELLEVLERLELVDVLVLVLLVDACGVVLDVVAGRDVDVEVLVELLVVLVVVAGAWPRQVAA